MGSLIAGCSGEPFDTSRKIGERGTLGEEIFKLLHRDLEREAPDRAVGFERERTGFVRTVDHLFPEGELTEVQEFLVGLLPLYDDQTISTVTRRLSAVADRLSRDRAALDSLAAILNRDGYVSIAHQEALALRIARYPRYGRLMVKVLELARAHDGLDDDGRPDPAEDDSLQRLLRSLADNLAELELSAEAERTIVLAADLMLSEDVRLSEGTVAAPGGPSSIVARDVRGMAQVKLTPARTFPSGFVDQSPADGLPDVDDAGRFVDSSGQVIDLPPFGAEGPRDGQARAIADPTGELVYQYVELDRTLLAGSMRDLRTMIAADVPAKARRTMERLLGERGPDGRYLADGNRLLDLAFALAETADHPDLPDVLELLATLVEQHEPTVTWAAIETEHQLEIADRHTISLKPGNSLFDDLMRVVRKILQEPGLAEDLLEALEDPAILRFPEAAATLSEFKNPLITHADFEAGRCFIERVDRAAPDRRDNQSLHQRVLHLIFDTRRARYEPRLIGIPLGFIFAIEDQAEFYMLSIIGQAEIPALVSTLTGLSERPTPEELAVFLNEDQTFGNPKGNEGIDVKVNDGDTLFAASASGMTDALRPLVTLFHAHGRLDLLFELFEVLHLHWASPEGGDYQDQSRGQPRYSFLSGIRRYEPLLIDTFRDAKVLHAVRRLVMETEQVRTSSGKTARQILLSLARQLKLKDPDLRTRAGAREVLLDGQRVTPLSPFDLIRGARAELKAVVNRSGQGQQDWDGLIDELHRVFMATERTGPETGRFTNGRLKPVASLVLRFLAERARRHQQLGDLAGWPQREMVDGMSDLVTSDELPAMIDLLQAIEADPELEEMLLELRDQLLAEDEGFPDLLAIGGDRLAAAKDASLAVPFLRFLGREMDPDSGLPFVLMDFARTSLDRDPDQRLLETARRGLELAPNGELYLQGLSGAIRQANRLDTRSSKPLDGRDVGRIVEIVGRYLVDDQHGMEKFYQLVANR